MLNLDQTRKDAALLTDIFAGAPVELAANLRAANAARPNLTPTTQQPTTIVKETNIDFTQNNNSPKSLSEYEIYRQTQNQLRMFKEATL